MKTINLPVIISVVALLAVVGGAWSTKQIEERDPDVIARNGMHAHATLKLYADGVLQDIPRSVGLGATHNPMHTHAEDEFIHMEFAGTVRKMDTMVGHFFDVWGREFDSFGTPMRMTVNGNENTEFANYAMKDGDVIEIWYESSTSSIAE